jgi:hypothetical protein
MKNYIILSVFFLSVIGCKCQKNTTVNNVNAQNNMSENSVNTNISSTKDLPVVYYDASSRGFFISAKIENQKVYYSSDRNFPKHNQEMPITGADWQEMVKLINQIDLEKVKDMKWPTEMRYYDGAPHANITFIQGDKKYEGPGFDHGYPPAEVEKLVNLLFNNYLNKK